MSNRIDLARLVSMRKEELHAIPLDQIVMLLEDIADLKAQAKAADNIITSELDRRFGAKAAELRKEQGKDTGTVTLVEGEFKIEADLPKKPSWDQSKLANVFAAISEWDGEDQADYITVEYKVSETKYNAWPASIKRLFDPARTVGVGTASYKIKPASAPAKRRAA